MKRREILSTVAMTTVGISGCTGGYTESAPSEEEDTSTSTTTQTTQKPDNPWGKLPVIVGLERVASGHRGINQKVQDTLTFWEDNAETYVGFPMEYAYEPNNSDADITVKVQEEIAVCGSHDTDYRTVGCAPLIESTAPETAEIRIVSDLEGETLLRVLKHEFGHTLGLDHGEEPQEIMSDDPELRIPDYQERRDIISAYRDGIDAFSKASEKYNTGSEHYDNEELGEAKNLFEDGSKLAQDGATAFGNAESISLSIEEQLAAEFSSEARQKCLKYYNSQLELSRACEAYADGNYDRGDEFISEHQKYHEEMQSFQIRDSNLLVDELGL